MALSWYYQSDEGQQGPFDDAQIRDLVKKQVISSETSVWTEKMIDWQPAGETELKRLLSAGAGEAATADQPCCRCGDNFPVNDLLELDGELICAGCKPQYLRDLQGGARPDAYYHFGGFWIRVGSKLIDGVILWLVQLPIGLVLGGVLGFSNQGSDFKLSTMLFVQAINISSSIIIPMIYNVWFLTWKSATPGKLILGLKIINADGSEKISFGKAIGRFFAEYLSSLILCIGYIIAAFDDEKRTLHDHICKTRVVYSRK